MRKLWIKVAILMVFQASLCALPSQVLIIRHAEKPEDGNGLSLKGRERAEALAPYFTGNEALTKFGPPVAIYAQKPTEAHPSLRPVQTVTPLAEVLKLKIHEQYERGQTDKMAEEIKTKPEYEGKTIVVSWDHHEIPDLAHALGAEEAPKKWDDHHYDRVWQVEFPTENEVTFTDKPQRLLFGDSP